MARFETGSPGLALTAVFILRYSRVNSMNNVF